MRKTIVRTITATTIQSVQLKFVNGKAELIDNKELTLNGKIDEATALKVIRKEYGENAQLKSVEETTNAYEISVENFIKHATVIPILTKEQAEELQRIEEGNKRLQEIAKNDSKKEE